MKTDSFEKLPIPRREIMLPAGRYRVYKDAKDFVVVEAVNAQEAFRASGFGEALRIERDGIYLHNVIDLAALAVTPQPSAPPTASAAPPEPAEAQPQAESAKADAPPPASDQPLSGAEVDKLLNGGGAGANANA